MVGYANMEMTCSGCSQAFEVRKEELTCLKKASPIFGGNTYSIPPPTQCPPCRNQRRMSWRNDRTFYKRTCDLTGDDLIAIYPKDSPFTIYKPEAWYGDEWNAMDYGRDLDLGRSFLEQFRELQKEVPRLGVDIVNCENSDYCNYCGDDKNCYLDIAGEANEDCRYNLFIKYCKDTADSTFVYNSTLCYECIQCYDCYACTWSQYLDNCSDCSFCFDLKGCKNCLFCVNVREKQYHIFNEPHTKEEYEKKLKELNVGSYTALQSALSIWKEKRIEAGIYRHMYNVNCENCTGNNIKNSKSCLHCFNTTNCEDSSYLYDVLDAKDCQDVNYSLYKPEAAYELCSTLNMRFSAFSHASHYSTNIYYCENINHSHDLFGCISLMHGEYCILNKQYSKEEYEELVPKIIERMKQDSEWGEFFPVALSPFAYNETVAHEYLPLSKEDVEKKGWTWRDDLPFTQGKETVTWEHIPDHIADAAETIVKEILLCQSCSRNFKIIKQEYSFYKAQGIPLPRTCPDCRHRARIALRNPRMLWEGTCAKCSKNIQTSYSPDRREKVLCEECYLKEMY